MFKDENNNKHVNDEKKKESEKKWGKKGNRDHTLCEISCNWLNSMKRVHVQHKTIE